MTARLTVVVVLAAITEIWHRIEAIGEAEHNRRFAQNDWRED